MTARGGYFYAENSFGTYYISYFTAVEMPGGIVIDEGADIMMKAWSDDQSIAADFTAAIVGADDVALGRLQDLLVELFPLGCGVGPFILARGVYSCWGRPQAALRVVKALPVLRDLTRPCNDANLENR